MLKKLLTGTLLGLTLAFSNLGCQEYCTDMTPQQMKEHSKGDPLKTNICLAQIAGYAKRDIGLDEPDSCNWDRKKAALNGANSQSCLETMIRECGVCRDFSVCGSWLGGYDLNLSVLFENGPGHSVTLYQDENGMYGTIGQLGDYRKPIFPTLKELAEDIASELGKKVKSFRVYDLSTVNTLNGTNDGMILKSPFIIYEWVKKDNKEINGTITKNALGYFFERNITSDNENDLDSIYAEYTKKLFLEYELQEWNLSDDAPYTAKKSVETIILDRYIDQRPLVKSIITTFKNGFVLEDRTRLTYQSGLNVKKSETETFSNDNFIKYEVVTKTFSDDGERVIAIKTETSDDGDYEFDKVKYFTNNEDGSQSFYYDDNADGVWDRIQLIVKNPDGTRTFYYDNNADGVWDEEVTY